MLILLPAALIMLQPDLGSAVIMIVSAFVILFLSGYPLSFFGILGFAGIGAFVALIAAAPYRLARIKSYIDPWSDPLGAGFQGIQSLFAIAPGGLFGHGYGNSRQKYLYLPEPQNDFIFSIIAEETGFIGATFILVLFSVLLLSAFGIAIRTQDYKAFLNDCRNGVDDHFSNFPECRRRLGFIASDRSDITVHQLRRFFVAHDMDGGWNYFTFRFL